MKFESAAQDLDGLPHVAGSLSNLGNDDRHLAERMRKAVDGEIARRYRLFKDAGARDATSTRRCDWPAVIWNRFPFCW